MLLFIAVALLGILAAANQRYIHTNYYRKLVERQNIIFSAKDIPDGLLIANFGSAQGRFAFHYADIGIKGYNFAESPQSLAYDFRLLKQFSYKLAKGCKVLITLSMFIFLFEDYDKNTVNAKYYYALDPENIVNYSKFKHLIYTKFPVLTAGINALHIIKDTKAMRYMDVGTSDYDENAALKNAKHMALGWQKQFGLKDFRTTEIPLELQKHMDAVTIILEEMITYCFQNGFEPVLMGLPISKALNEQFSDEFLERIYYGNIKRVVKQNVRFYDYRKEYDFQEHYDWYIDGVCWLTSEGRRQLMKRIENNLFTDRLAQN